MDPPLDSVLNLSPAIDEAPRKQFNDGGFRMECFSSNNPDFFNTRPGYIICRDELGVEFVQSKVWIEANCAMTFAMYSFSTFISVFWS